jgi:hypothetical protein
VQDPQLSVRRAPQASTVIATPHEAPSRVHNWASVSAAHPQVFGWVAPHVRPPVQVPQFSVRWAPQESTVVATPHEAPSRVHSWALVSATVQPQRFG